MNKALTISLAAAVISAALSLVAVGGPKRELVATTSVMPAGEILTTVRALSLNPIGEPIRRGPYYVLHAYDPGGVEVRVVVDAHFGDVLSVTPVATALTLYAPQYQRGPRIIHVPQPGERQADTNDGADDRTDTNERDEPALSTCNDDEDIAPPPRPRLEKPKPRARATHPRWKLRSDVPPPPPPGPSRAVLSAPPPSAEGPTPIYPTPRFDSKADATEKFVVPRGNAVTPGEPPRGYTPPATPAQDD